MCFLAHFPDLSQPASSLLSLWMTTATTRLPAGVDLGLYISTGIELQDNPVAEHILHNLHMNNHEYIGIHSNHSRHARCQRDPTTHYFTRRFHGPGMSRDNETERGQFSSAFDAQTKSTSCATHSWRTFCNSAISSKPWRGFAGLLVRAVASAW